VGRGVRTRAWHTLTAELVKSDTLAMAAVLLVLFPLLVLYDTRLGVATLLVAIVLLYNRSPSR
jgi:hypothetical protein